MQIETPCNKKNIKKKKMEEEEVVILKNTLNLTAIGDLLKSIADSGDPAGNGETSRYWLGRHEVVKTIGTLVANRFKVPMFCYYRSYFVNCVFKSPLAPHQDSGFEILKGKHALLQSWAKLVDGPGICVAKRAANQGLYSIIDRLSYPICLKYQTSSDSFLICRQFAEGKPEEQGAICHVKRTDVVFEELKCAVGDVVLFRTDLVHFSMPCGLNDYRLAMAIRFLPETFSIPVSEVEEMERENRARGLSEVHLKQLFARPRERAVAAGSTVVKAVHFDRYDQDVVVVFQPDL